MLDQVLEDLLAYIEKEGYKGYDPYDTLLSPFPFHWAGKWGSVIAVQIQKRNPVNIRPLIGIKKGYNPKAMGLLLQSYAQLWSLDPRDNYLRQADYLFRWLDVNRSQGYHGASWGYNFPWAIPIKYLDPHVPTTVVTAMVARGLHAYHSITGNVDAAQLINQATEFVLKDLHFHREDTGTCISYTPVMQDICYNASLLAAEILARDLCVNKLDSNRVLIRQLVDFVVSRQHPDGRWDYSESITDGSRRVQTDFHQGYILESIAEIAGLIAEMPTEWDHALNIGLSFYHNQQFRSNGQSLWRLPKAYPVDIHNQSQGIITFSKLRHFNEAYLPFAESIANWTVNNMRNPDASFKYRVLRTHKNSIRFMRWSQAWMLIALVTLKTALEEKAKSQN